MRSKLLWFIGILLLSVGCQTEAPTQLIEVTRIVEVTREVVRETTIEQTVIVTQFATVAVPVEVTREVFVKVTPIPQVTDTPTPIIEEEKEDTAAIGTAARPIILLFSPIYPKQVIELRADNLATQLSEQTEYAYEIVAPETHEQLLTALCDNPERTIAFVSNIEYVLAHKACDAQIRFAGIKQGIAWNASMIVVPRNNPNIDQLTELDGASWGVASETDLVNSLYFQALFDAEGITPAEVIEYETDTRTMIASADFEHDFATAAYLSPIFPYDNEQWVYGEDDPEEWLVRAGSYPYRSGIGFMVVIGYPEYGGWRVRDARASAADVRESVFINTDILRVSELFPNDAVVYAPALPISIVTPLDKALAAVSTAEACPTHLCSTDLFSWEGLERVDDDFYDPIRFVQTQLELSDEEMLALIATP